MSAQEAADAARSALVGNPPDPTKKPSATGLLQAVDLLVEAIEAVEGISDEVEGYVAQAEAARDAALDGADFYDDTSDGLADTSTGDYFRVLLGTGDGYTLYRHDAGPVATVIDTFPNKASIEELSDIDVLGRTVDPANGSAFFDTVFVLANAVANDGQIIAARIYAKATGSFKLKRFHKSGDLFTQIGDDVVVTVPVTGLQTLSVDMPVSAGDYIGLHGPAVLAFTLDTADGAGYYESSTSGNVRFFSDSAAATAARFQLGLDIKVGRVSSNANRITALEGTAGDVVGVRQVIGRPDGTTPVTGFGSTNRPFVFNEPVTSDGIVRKVRLFAMVAGAVFIKRYIRDGNDFHQIGEDLRLSVAAGLNEIDAERFGSMRVLAGEYLAYYGPGVVAYTTALADSGGFFADVSAGNLEDMTSASATTGIQLQLSIEIAVGEYHLAASRTFARDVTGYGDRVSEVRLARDGLDVDATVHLNRASATLEVTDTIACTPTTSGYIRYDLLYIDGDTLALDIEQGVERTTDPTVGIPSLADPKQIPAALLRIDNGFVSPVLLEQVFDGEKAALSMQLEADRRRSRSLLPVTRRLIHRGSNLHIVGFGDSITALQNAVPSSTTPNGTQRDRGAAAIGDTQHYLRDGYGDDVVDALPLFTSVQLGRSNDGAGAVHTKVGWNWELVAALEEQWGYVLGTTLSYDNFGIAGATTGNAVIGVTPTSWLTSAVALGADLAVVALGMNERGEVGTEDRLAVIVETFQNAGTEVILIDCPRPRDDYFNWQYTCRATERVARYMNCAHVSLQPFFDTPNLGAAGLSWRDICEANGNNHPGLLEYSVIGRALIRSVLD